ncbi:uncharacterized protein PG986_014537 [Apiospora aurea]|uniref:Uncharacterized protein n=1 Tax=Apiospora aurea TaxID=335848 RepID=A0ABR1PT92_9PEZI
MATTTVVSTANTTTSSLAGRLKYPRTDPKYAQSFGTEAFHQRQSLGPIKYQSTGWTVVGLVAEKWEKLRGPLHSFIQEKRPVWVAKKPKGEPGECTGNDLPHYILDCFLLGLDQGHASPYVAAISPETWFFKMIGVHLTRSHLLSPDGFKCFGLPAKVVAPPGSVANDEKDQTKARVDRLGSFFDGPLLPTWQHALLRLDEDRCQGVTAKKTGEGPLTSFAGFHGGLRKGLVWDCDTFNGIGIEIRHGNHVVTSATLGGVLRLGGEMYAMTVRHALILRDPTATTSDATVDDMDDHEDFLQFFDEASEGSSETLSEDLEQEVGETSTGSDAAESQIARRADLGLRMPMMDGLDWILKKAPKWAANRDFTPLGDEKGDEQVVIKTPLGLKEAKFVSTAILGVPHTPKPHHVLLGS